MRRALRILSTLLIVAGAGMLAWAVLVWRWEDPFTSVYTAYEQRELSHAYDEKVEAFRLPETRAATAGGRPQAVAVAALRYRRSLAAGDAIARLRIPRMDLSVLVVEGTDHETLKKGPGRYRRSALPGEHRLVYVAGHRTTYGAPFSKIESLRAGDRVVLELPYATFEYRVTGHRIVAADAVEVLRPGRREVLALQACHPRFFASHRFIAYAAPVKVTPRGGTPYRPTATLATS